MYAITTVCTSTYAIESVDKYVSVDIFSLSPYIHIHIIHINMKIHIDIYHR